MENILKDSLYNYENIKLGVKIKNPTRQEALDIYKKFKDEYRENGITKDVIYFLFTNMVKTTKDSKVDFKSMTPDELANIIENPRISEDFEDMIYSITNIYSRIMKMGMKEDVMLLEIEELNLLSLHMQLITSEYVETAQNIERTKFKIEKERNKIKKKKGK